MRYGPMRYGLTIFTLLMAAAVALTAAACAEIGAVRDAARMLEESSAVLSDSNGNANGIEQALPPVDVRAVRNTLDDLPIAPRGSGIDYDRGDWRHWVDVDGDCQNTRAEVLIAESRAAVSFAPRDDNDQCRVVSGQWRGPWSGEIFTDAGEVDIDHHVPLAHAHESGGWGWDADRKSDYANDLSIPASLQAMQAALNREKGKQPPDQWRPPRQAAWCRYAADWIAVKARWQLTVTDAEIAALRDMLDTCESADPEAQP